MMIRNLVISLGITTLSSFLLYMYFKNRMSDVESKVDIMFQLIQEHTAANEAAAAAAALQNVHNQINSHPASPQSYHSETGSNLVDVSDDEDGGSSSEEVSDSEDEETHSIMPQIDESDIAHLRENIFEEETNNIKKINLNIHGSETSPPQESIVLNNLEDLQIDPTQDQTPTKEMKVEEVDSSDLNIDGDTQVNLTMLTPEINTEEEEDEDKELSDKELNDIILEEDEEDNTKKITVTEEVELDPETLRRKTVVQLKEIAAQKKLQKYKSLTKKRLIDLISNSQ